jgi:hypothetical protein
MSVVDFVQIRDTAIEQIGAAFADKKIHIAAHPGIFNEAEIRRLSQKTPAILTSFIRYTDEDVRRDVNEAPAVQFVSWVLYRSTNKDALYDGALKIVSALAPVLREVDAEWSIGGGANIEAECLYSGSLDSINVTLWGVKWQWRIRETVFSDGEGGVLLPDDLEIFEGYDAAHEIGNATAYDEAHLEVSNANTV